MRAPLFQEASHRGSHKAPGLKKRAGRLGQGQGASRKRAGRLGQGEAKQGASRKRAGRLGHTTREQAAYSMPFPSPPVLSHHLRGASETGSPESPSPPPPPAAAPRPARIWTGSCSAAPRRPRPPRPCHSARPTFAAIWLSLLVLLSSPSLFGFLPSVFPCFLFGVDFSAETNGRKQRHGLNGGWPFLDQDP